MPVLDSFMPHCRWVIVDQRTGTPCTAASDKEAVIRAMQAAAEADRGHLWVVDRLAGERAPFDHSHNRMASYGWSDPSETPMPAAERAG